MKRFVIAGMLAMAAGCGGSNESGSTDLIGKTVMVSASENGNPKFPGEILAVSPDRDPEKITIMPKYLPPFRAIVIDEVNDAKSLDGPYPDRWIVRPEETEYAGVVVGVHKKEVKLTPLK